MYRKTKKKRTLTHRNTYIHVSNHYLPNEKSSLISFFLLFSCSLFFLLFSNSFLLMFVVVRCLLLFVACCCLSMCHSCHAVVAPWLRSVTGQQTIVFCICTCVVVLVVVVCCLWMLLLMFVIVDCLLFVTCSLCSTIMKTSYVPTS